MAGFVGNLLGEILMFSVKKKCAKAIRDQSGHLSSLLSLDIIRFNGFLVLRTIFAQEFSDEDGDLSLVSAWFVSKLALDGFAFSALLLLVGGGAVLPVILSNPLGNIQ